MSASPTPAPRNWRSIVVWIGLGVVLLLFLAAVVPGSPLHLSVLLNPPRSRDGRSVRELTRALSDPDPDARRAAAVALGRLNADAVDALPRLAEVMRTDPEPMVRAAAADAINKMAPASRAVVNDMAAALSDPEPLVRMNAAMGLCRLKQDARPAIPALIAAAEADGNDTNLKLYLMTIRQMVFRALGTAAAGTGDAVPTLSAALARSGSDTLTTEVVVQGLGLAGPHARDCAPAIRALLRNPVADVRRAAEEALPLIEGGG